MSWVIAAVAVAAATVAATTALLLAYSGQRNDPVGRLSPVASTGRVVPAAPTTTLTVERDDGRHSDD